uniref:Multiple C2 and transmembrane domain-containing protein 1 n=1 Tax=Panagrellus redivivus TaxID=6233 RepID=A0A7E4VRZ0_PANRE
MRKSMYGVESAPTTPARHRRRSSRLESDHRDATTMHLDCVSTLPTVDSEPFQLADLMGASCSTGPSTRPRGIQLDDADGPDADYDDDTSLAQALYRGNGDAAKLPSKPTFRQRVLNNLRFPLKMKNLRRLTTRSALPIEDCDRRFNIPIEAENLTDHDTDSPFVVFRVKVHLKEAHGLVIRDASGASDPYVKFKYEDRTIYKSSTVFRSLNPHWDEEFAFLTFDPTNDLIIEVFDYDRFMMDDSMGATKVSVAPLTLFQTQDFKLNLKEDGPNSEDQYMGYIMLSVNVTPLTAAQKTEFEAKAVRGIVTEPTKRSNKGNNVWLSVVNIVLVEAKLTPNQATAALPDPYVKFKLNNEKCKSKNVSKTYEPRWVEQFDLHIFDDNFQVLNVLIRDKVANADIGSVNIDLAEVERDRTYEQWYDLENNAGSVLLLLTVSGTAMSAGTVTDLANVTANRMDIVEKYSLRNSLSSIKDVGHLTVKVFKAIDLIAADIGGKSDPFCVLEIVNARLQTHTEYKTLNPVWNKLFTFAVKDIHEILEVTVYDEDPNKRVEFLGKVSIPLLQIRNGERMWYYLKDKKQAKRSKGAILLEMEVLWNPVKAAIRTFNPREQKHLSQDTRFKPALMMDSVRRLKVFLAYVASCKAYVDDCLSWKSKPRSICAFLIFLCFVYFVEIYHFPMLLALFFLKYHLYPNNTDNFEFRKSTEAENADNDDDDEEYDQQPKPPLKRSVTAPPNPKTNSERTSFTNKFQQVQDILTVVQSILDFAATLLERLRNTFNFTVPYLSYLMITVLGIAATLLYFVPLRWIVLVWGINKFSKRLRNPNYVDNNELLDFLSRVPSDKELQVFEVKATPDSASVNGRPTSSSQRAGSNGVTQRVPPTSRQSATSTRQSSDSANGQSTSKTTSRPLVPQFSLPESVSSHTSSDPTDPVVSSTNNNNNDKKDD